MNIPTKFVSPLNEEQITELNRIVKESGKPRVRQHTHAILLSN